MTLGYGEDSMKAAVGMAHSFRESPAREQRKMERTKFRIQSFDLLPLRVREKL